MTNPMEKSQTEKTVSSLFRFGASLVVSGMAIAGVVNGSWHHAIKDCEKDAKSLAHITRLVERREADGSISYEEASRYYCYEFRNPSGVYASLRDMESGTGVTVKEWRLAGNYDFRSGKRTIYPNGLLQTIILGIAFPLPVIFAILFVKDFWKMHREDFPGKDK